MADLLFDPALFAGEDAVGRADEAAGEGRLQPDAAGVCRDGIRKAISGVVAGRAGGTDYVVPTYSKRRSIRDCPEQLWGWDAVAAWLWRGAGAGVHGCRRDRTGSWDRLWHCCFGELPALAFVWAAESQVEWLMDRMADGSNG